jgi:hypothetical protein
VANLPNTRAPDADLLDTLDDADAAWGPARVGRDHSLERAAAC